MYLFFEIEYIVFSIRVNDNNKGIFVDFQEKGL